MRLMLALVAAVVGVTAAAPDAEAQAQARKRRGDTVIVVKQRSFLDAGTQAQPGAYQNYSLGQTPFRPSDSIVPTGSVQGRLLPGQFGAFR
jgi:hypothetical protein